MRQNAGVTCCTPRQYHSPSGLAWFHARDCAIGRGQKIRNVYVQPVADVARRAREEAETARTGVVVPIRPVLPERTGALHPACIAARADGATPCSECSWRMGLDNEGARWMQSKIDAEGIL